MAETTHHFICSLTAFCASMVTREGDPNSSRRFNDVINREEVAVLGTSLRIKAQSAGVRAREIETEIETKYKIEYILAQKSQLNRQAQTKV